MLLGVGCPAFPSAVVQLVAEFEPMLSQSHPVFVVPSWDLEPALCSRAIGAALGNCLMTYLKVLGRYAKAFST